MVGTNLVSFITLCFLLNMKLPSSNGIDKEHTDEAISCFISLAPFVGNDELQNNIASHRSLSTMFLETDGFNYDRTTRSDGNGPVNLGVDS